MLRRSACCPGRRTRGAPVILALNGKGRCLVAVSDRRDRPLAAAARRAANGSTAAIAVVEFGTARVSDRPHGVVIERPFDGANDSAGSYPTTLRPKSNRTRRLLADGAGSMEHHVGDWLDLARLVHAVAEVHVIGKRAGVSVGKSERRRARRPLQNRPEYPRIGVGNGDSRPLPPNPLCSSPATGSPVSCFHIGIGAPSGGPQTS